MKRLFGCLAVACVLQGKKYHGTGRALGRTGRFSLRFDSLQLVVLYYIRNSLACTLIPRQAEVRHKAAKEEVGHSALRCRGRRWDGMSVTDVVRTGQLFVSCLVLRSRSHASSFSFHSFRLLDFSSSNKCHSAIASHRMEAASLAWRIMSFARGTQASCS